MQKSDTADQTDVSKQNVTVTPSVLTAGHIQALSSAPGQQATIGTKYSVMSSCCSLACLHW